MKKISYAKVGCMYCAFFAYSKEVLAEHFKTDHKDQTVGAQPPVDKAVI